MSFLKPQLSLFLSQCPQATWQTAAIQLTYLGLSLLKSLPDCKRFRQKINIFLFCFGFGCLFIFVVVCLFVFGFVWVGLLFFFQIQNQHFIPIWYQVEISWEIDFLDFFSSVSKSIFILEILSNTFSSHLFCNLVVLSPTIFQLISNSQLLPFQCYYSCNYLGKKKTNRFCFCSPSFSGELYQSCKKVFKRLD